jgi:hypothetical protein
LLQQRHVDGIEQSVAVRAAASCVIISRQTDCIVGKVQ